MATKSDSQLADQRRSASMFLSAAFDDPASKYILPAISVVPVALPFQADQDRE